jgi:hypothetical protein
MIPDRGKPRQKIGDLWESVIANPQVFVEQHRKSGNIPIQKLQTHAPDSGRGGANRPIKSFSVKDVVGFKLVLSGQTTSVYSGTSKIVKVVSEIISTIFSPPFPTLIPIIIDGFVGCFGQYSLTLITFFIIANI